MRYSLNTSIAGHEIEANVSGVPAFLFLALVLNTDKAFQSAFRPEFQKAHEVLREMKIVDTAENGAIVLNEFGRMVARRNLNAILRTLGADDHEHTSAFDTIRRRLELEG